MKFEREGERGECEARVEREARAEREARVECEARASVKCLLSYNVRLCSTCSSHWAETYLYSLKSNDFEGDLFGLDFLGTLYKNASICLGDMICSVY